MPNWEELEDPQLLDAAQNGIAEAFGALYTRYAGMVFRFLYAHLDERLDAEDLTEEVFLKTWRSLPNYKRRGVPFSAFLLRVARNLLADFYRRSLPHKHLTSMEDLAEISGQSHDHSSSISTHMEHRELVRVMSRLKMDYRTVLVLRFFNGLSPTETAQVMGRSTGAIRVLQTRALDQLRKLLKEEINLSEDDEQEQA